MTAYTIGVDIGTTGTKSILLEVGRGIVATAQRDQALHSQKTGWAEADPARWVENTADTVAELMAVSGVNPNSVVGLATSGMVPAVTLLDSELKPVRFSALQNDARAGGEIAELQKALSGVDLVSETGSALSQQSVAPTLLWFGRREPDLWEQVRFVTGSYDYVLTALGARPHVELNWALESGLFTIEGKPHPEVMATLALGSQKIPEVLAPGTLAGTLSQEFAARMGLSPGMPLFVGGADHVLSAYSAGVAHTGDWLIKLGGAGDILVKTDEPVLDSRLYLDAHPVPGNWLTNGCMATSGSLIRWFQGIVRETDLVAFDEQAASREPAQVLCLPYFLGEKSPLHDPDLRGSFFGMHLGTTTADLYRSVLEAIAFGFRHHAEIFMERGIALHRAMVTNGGSKSTLWKQIHADVLGVDLHPVVDHPGASLGAAVIAGVGAGAIRDWEAISEYVVLGPTVHPRPEMTTIYDRAYLEWRELGSVTASVAHKLSERTR
jgi:xylulokinase